MSKATHLTAFIFGLAIGSIATATLIKNRYEQLVQEEVDSIKEVLLKEFKKPKKDDRAIDEVREYKERVTKSGYMNYASYARDEQKQTIEPYIIKPEEFGEIDDYETISLHYYADGVLADDCDELVEDVEEVVGVDFFSHFGEYEDDSVFVRNDRLSCDYEILLDSHTYSEVLDSKPYLRKEK
jgi:hypothetical protein